MKRPIETRRSAAFTLAREVNPLDGAWATAGGDDGSPHGGATTPRMNVLLIHGEVMTINLTKMKALPNFLHQWPRLGRERNNAMGGRQDHARPAVAAPARRAG